MTRIIMATNNAHKLDEVRHILGEEYSVLGLADIGFNEDLAETSATLEGNALQKARYVHDRCGLDCFADDTGLMVDALNGEPGVYSARYAGEHCSFDDNINLLLDNMEGKTNRNARFETVICLIEDGKARYFEGKCEGCILTERYGRGGFGYDPIFMPKGYGESFAELSTEEKNKISHRGKATAELIKYLLK